MLFLGGIYRLQVYVTYCEAELVLYMDEQGLWEERK